jgi:putative peptidoglycan lipid II flippase
MLTVSGGIFFSRCLGLARDILFAQIWGTGLALAGFVLAFTVPNLLRALFGEGAFSAAFVPIFSEKLEREGKTCAWQGACRIVSVLAVVLTAVVAAALGVSFLLRPLLKGELAEWTLELLPWLLPYGILICLAAAFSAILNSVNRFFLTTYSQLLLNVCMILAALAAGYVFADDPRQGIMLVSGAILLSGILQLAVLTLSCRREGWDFRFQPVFRDPVVQRFAILISPVLLGAGVMQLNVLVDRVLSGWLGSMATTTLYYSQRLVYLPVGLFGVAMSMVALPAMSRAWARGERREVIDGLGFALEQVLFLALPTMTLLYVLAEPAVRLLFERGAFGPASTAETAWTLLFYLGGIPAFTCAKIVAVPFYAQQDTRTPMRVAMLCLVLNVVLNLILMQFLRQGGLALATSICSFVNIALLLRVLRRRLGGLGLRRLAGRVARMLMACCVSGAAAWTMLDRLGNWGTGLGGKLIQVMLPLAAGGLVYLGVASLLGCAYWRNFIERSTANPRESGA